MSTAVMPESSQCRGAQSNGSSRAVVIRGPGHASIEHVPLPPIGPDDVLIRVHFEGVCATDLEILDGVLGYYHDHLAEYPIVPGHEVSGHIVAAGAAVRNTAVGDAVVVECIQSCHQCDACRRHAWIHCARRTELGVIGRNGGYAEYLVVPARFVHRIPPTLDLRTACLCEPLAVALKGHHRLQRACEPCNEPGRCAIVGAGPLGHLCGRVLVRQNHDVSVFDQDERRLAPWRDAGIDTSTDLDRLGEFEVLIEATGSQSALEKVLLRSPAGAAILLLGLPYENAGFRFERIVGYDKIVVGSVGSSAADFDEALRLLPRLDTRALTRTVLPLDCFREGWRLARQRDCLKVLFAP